MNQASMSSFSDSLAHPLIVIVGATASGKTRLAVELAQLLGGEILSADSRQIYRGLDLGSGKDLAEYGHIRYHLIDIADLGEPYQVCRYQQDFWQAYNQVVARGALPILCGGSGLYLDAILNGYQFADVAPNPELRQQWANDPLSDMAAQLQQLNPLLWASTDLSVRSRVERALEISLAGHNEQRSAYPKPQALVLGIHWPREQLRQRIAERLQQRLDAGLIEEVAALRELHGDASLEALGLEYRYISRYLRGELDDAQLFSQLATAIGQFAKRQETWLRRMQRHGTTIHSLDGQQPLLPQALAVLESSR